MLSRNSLQTHQVPSIVSTCCLSLSHRTTVRLPFTPITSFFSQAENGFSIIIFFFSSIIFKIRILACMGLGSGNGSMRTVFVVLKRISARRSFKLSFFIVRLGNGSLYTCWHRFVGTRLRDTCQQASVDSASLPAFLLHFLLRFRSSTGAWRLLGGKKQAYIAMTAILYEAAGLVYCLRFYYPKQSY